jgi:hypothetical protein
MLDAAASVCHAYLRNASLNPVQRRPENLNKDKQLKKDAQSQQCGYTPLTGKPDRNIPFVGTCTLMPLREAVAVKHNQRSNAPKLAKLRIKLRRLMPFFPVHQKER